MKNVSLELSGFEKLSANELAKVSGGNKIETATIIKGKEQDIEQEADQEENTWAVDGLDDLI